MIRIKKIINPDVKNTEYLDYCRLEWAVYMNQFLQLTCQFLWIQSIDLALCQ